MGQKRSKKRKIEKKRKPVSKAVKGRTNSSREKEKTISIKVKEKMSEKWTKIAMIGCIREYAREVKNDGIDISLKKEAREKENPSCPADQDLLAQEKLAPSQSLEVSHPLESQIAHHVLTGYEEIARKAKNAIFIM